MFDRYLNEQGLKARGGQIIDATLVPVPQQGNQRKENEDQAGEDTGGVAGQSPRLRQKSGCQVGEATTATRTVSVLR